MRVRGIDAGVLCPEPGRGHVRYSCLCASLSERFVSLYIASDTTFLILSWLQALTFQAWREGSRQRHPSDSHDSELLHREP